ncbi:MAG TPA: 16S rRNA (cytidine(1402)-2'-O)-methyltransferase [Acidobacteriaceae bacterium]|nr:16S rRNA (cytidine(1402)-2'-O)-methyltransferase [Acidobacteriaceae bacterium]
MLEPGLYLVATPIGNLEDITLRALRVLKSVDRIACEDTRETQKLLHHFDISTPTVSYHEHNERSRTAELILDLQNGGSIAVVSDAGTPAFSDPGVELVRAALAAGIRVFPIPGANAALSALVASGLNTDSFVYLGFLPSRPGQRRTQLETLAAHPSGQTLIVYEAPHRILDTLADVEGVWGGSVCVVIARELTKLHEEFLRGTVADVRGELSGRDRIRGEIVLLIAATPPAQALESNMSIARLITHLIATEGLEEKEALKRVARERGVSKSDVYRELQRERSRR